MSENIPIRPPRAMNWSRVRSLRHSLVTGVMAGFVLVLMSTTMVRAETALQMAAESWLNNDDSMALPILADLAVAGDRDARLLLGQIARRPHSPWLATKDDETRDRLLRPEGEGAGKSWLQLAADRGDLHALALQGADREPYVFVKVQALIEHGESESAIRFVLGWVSRGGAIQAEFAALPQAFGRDGAYAAYLNLISHGIIKSFNLRGDPSDPAIWTPDSLLLYQAFLARQKKDPPPSVAAWIGALSGDVATVDPVHAETVGEMLGQMPETTRNLIAVRRYCEETCPGNPTACLGVVTAMHVDGLNSLWRYSSPSNTIIPPDDYYKSARAVAEVGETLQSRTEAPGDGRFVRRWRDSLACLKAAS